MTNEALIIPEERLQDVITIIRMGIGRYWKVKHINISAETIEQLEKWCKEQEEYLQNNKD
jgi:hypothetical protein